MSSSTKKTQLLDTATGDMICLWVYIWKNTIGLNQSRFITISHDNSHGFMDPLTKVYRDGDHAQCWCCNSRAIGMLADFSYISGRGFLYIVRWFFLWLVQLQEEYTVRDTLKTLGVICIKNISAVWFLFLDGGRNT